RSGRRDHHSGEGARPTVGALDSGADRPPSTSTDRRWSIRRHATPARWWQSGHRLPPSGADRPPSWIKRGASTTVLDQSGPIDHRLDHRGTDRPPSTSEQDESSTVTPATRTRERIRRANAYAAPARARHADDTR